MNKVIQHKGPFTSGQSIVVGGDSFDYLYVHIGIQIPQREFIANITNESATPDLTISNVDGSEARMFRINDSQILEFDGLAKSGLRITFNRNLPKESIIDVIYRKM